MSVKEAQFCPAEEQTRHLGTSIQEISKLQPFLGTLSGLGYLTFEHLVFAPESTKRQLSGLLGADVDALISSIDIRPTAIPPDDMKSLREARYQLGFSMKSIEPPDIPPSEPLQVLDGENPEVNLIPQMPPVRYQGNRPTCVAFAALSAFEHYKRRMGDHQDFSEQFLYWSCKERDGDRDGRGTNLGIAIPLLRDDGCCTEATWPYNSEPRAANEGQGPPPEDAQLEALDNRISTFKKLIPKSVLDLKRELASGCPVAFSVPSYQSWFKNIWVSYTGDIVLPTPGDSVEGGHSMCLVGYVEEPGAPGWGGGRFLVRNSWDRWGIKCRYGKGYGTIPFSYILRYSEEAYSIL